MKNSFTVFCIIVCVACHSEVPSLELHLTTRSIQTVPFTQIHLDDSFWSPKIEVNRTVTIPSALHQCDINGRFDNFAVAGGLLQKAHQGDFPFDDTDPYKVIEGASYSLAVQYDSALDHRLDSLIALIAAAQEDDGYLTTCVTNRCKRLSRWWGSSRWERLNSHELYNCGHMYEAAVAHYLATGKRNLLDVAIKNANLVCQVFGPNEGQKHVPSGHPIVEMALVKLYGVTGNTAYIDMAKYFIEEAGRGTDGHKLSPYSQDHKPVLQQDEIVGHAVRAGYFYSGVSDVTTLTQDTAYFRALCRVWDNMVSKKLYITGGIGSRAQGEGFGPNYELHNQQAYCETCAAIANVYWNYRMFLATGDARFIDVLERALYNGVISGVSLSGDRFFYDNPLESMGQHERQKWFGCACCPGNITRFIASVPHYMYAVQEDAIYVNLYIQSQAKVPHPSGTVTLTQRTNYPWEGDIALEVIPEQEGAFPLKVRIPQWVNSTPVPSNLYRYTTEALPFQVFVNDRPVRAHVEQGYITLSRTWKEGDVVRLHFPMEVRRIEAHPNVEDDLGKVALQRGPVVYCLEGADQVDSTVFNKYIPNDMPLQAEYHPELLNGVTVITGRDGAGNEITAIPYYAWNNRGVDQMAVWIPTSEEGIRPTPAPTIASQADTYMEVDGHPEGAWGVNDQWEPKRSSDASKPYHYWWLIFGKPVNLAYAFAQPTTVSRADVYWLDFDQYDGNFRVPAYWKLYYKDGRAWKEVTLTEGSHYGIEKDTYNTVQFKPVVTDGLKIEAQLQKGESGGIIEWKVQ